MRRSTRRRAADPPKHCSAWTFIRIDQRQFTLYSVVATIINVGLNDVTEDRWHLFVLELRYFTLPEG